MGEQQKNECKFKHELRILELFAGIGGVAAAVQQIDSPKLKIIQAVDIDVDAHDVYKRNFDHPYMIAEISSLDSRFFAECSANVWWLSPPCPPFSIRGRRSRNQQSHIDDLLDNRNLALLKSAENIARFQPQIVIIENVPGFEQSLTWNRVAQTLSASEYSYEVSTICPSELNWPNRRQRIYVIATRNDIFSNARIELKISNNSPVAVKLDSFIDTKINRVTHPELYLSDDIIERYRLALDRIELISLNSRTTACFASSYGKTILHAGSYLVCPDGTRRFSPHEVQRLLGFGDLFQWPNRLSERRKWSLLGNSLAIPVVVEILQSTIDFAEQNLLTTNY